MSNEVTAWTLDALHAAPPWGIKHPHDLRDDGGRLTLSCHWGLAVAGVAGLALGLFPLALLLASMLGALGPRGLPPFLAIFNLPAVLLLMTYQRRWGRFELLAEQGVGRLALGGLPVQRTFLFPLSAVRQVVLMHGVPVRGTQRTAVCVHLEDGRGGSRRLAICSGPLDQIREWAAALAERLEVEQAEADFADSRTHMPGPIDESPAPAAASAGDLPTVPTTQAGKGTLHFTLRKIAHKPSEPRCLRIVPAPLAWIILLVVAVGCVAPFLLSLVVFRGLPGVALLGMLPGLTIMAAYLLAILLAWPTWRFDRAAGECRFVRGLSVRRVVPLEEIAAVQSLDFSLDRDVPWPYELNLVLRSGERLSIVSGAKREFVRDTGLRLAGFLEIPWLDHMDAGG